MDSIDLSDESYNLMVNLVKQAGNLAMEGYNLREQKVETKKGEWDVVTYYDVEIEKLITNGIKAKFANHKFLAEETTKLIVLTDEPTWIIDPIDGTTNFIHKIPYFAINVAFALNKRLQFGITYAPALNEFYTARKNRGAYLNGNRIHCSNITNVNKAVVGQEGLMQIQGPIREKTAKRYYTIASAFMGYRSFGCAALGLCLVARGFLDAYTTEDLKPWDVAPGAIIVAEAGGSIGLVDGFPFDLLHGSINASCTTEINRELTRLVREADESPLNIF